MRSVTIVRLSFVSNLKEMPYSSLNFHGNDDCAISYFNFDGIDKMMAGDGENGGKRVLGR
ncbi:MAG: hypothetical protein K5882_10955 [Bacteroidales bacterium]|nr:hypothetical protein [Bacteroidales bacterium]